VLSCLPCIRSWNILDFLVIALGYLELGSLGNYTAIRVVRALRPLRVIQKIDEMRVLVETLIRLAAATMEGSQS
jgi:hypothetical protein